MPKEKTQMVPEPIHLFSHTVCTCAATPTPFPGPNWLTMANQANHSAKQQLQLLNFGEKATV